jgi:3-phosphoshikimate 1-carboxyvinyltransferase
VSGVHPAFLDLAPLAAAAGTVRLPGSKSLSNRTLLLAGLAEGITEIRDLLDSDDTARMLEALATLGVRVEAGPVSGSVRVHGCGGRFPVDEAELFLGNAGTAFRPLTAVLALNGGRYRLRGVARMHERPIGDLVEALRAMGASIHYEAVEGFPPLRIEEAPVRAPDTLRVRGDVSSQFLSALLMALPLTGRAAAVEVEGELISKPYVDITLNTLARFGVSVGRQGYQRFELPAGSRYRSPGVVHVEGDASGASYFLAAGAVGGGPVRVEGVGRGSIQGDVRFADALEGLGARVRWGDNWIEASAPASGRLKAFDLDLNHIPDAAMTLAVVALFTDGPCRLRNIASWRVKETDRIAAMANELRKLGACVVEHPDQLEVQPPGLLRGAAIETYDDHRIAMCLSLAALGGVPVRIIDPGCVAKTFPDYFERFAEVGQPARVPVIAIDGPSASGKGTVADRVAQVLGWRYLDSGAVYRLVGLAAMRAGVDLADEPALAVLAEGLQAEFRAGRVFLSGEDVTEAIRVETVSGAASKVAALPAVRASLLWRQRAFAGLPGLVAEGRDMGSVVFPDAELKVFLTASAQTRAERRYKQLIDKGMSVTLPALLQEIEERDARDRQRTAAPLRQADGARLLDTTDLGAEQAAQQVLGWFGRESS